MSPAVVTCVNRSTGYVFLSNESLWETLHDLLGLVCTGIRQTDKYDPRKEK